MLCRETAKSGLRDSIDAQNKPACSMVPPGLISRGPTAPVSGRCTCSAMIVSQSGSIASTLSSRKRSQGCRCARRHDFSRRNHSSASAKCNTRCEKSCGSLSDFVALAHLNDHYFVIRIARPADQAFDTSLERLEPWKLGMIMEIFLASRSSRLT